MYPGLYRGEIYDMFVSSATAEETVSFDADPAELVRQVSELRATYAATDMPDRLDLTDAEIAEFILAHAHSLINGTPDVWVSA